MRGVGELRVTGMVFSVPGLAVACGGVANDKSASVPLGAKLYTRCPLKVTEMPYPVKNVCVTFEVTATRSRREGEPPCAVSCS